ncbi:MAG: DUF1611 domain-containing protein [Roseiflexus sp.]
MITQIDFRRVKRTYTTHIVPDEALAGYITPSGSPCIGDLLVAEIINVGKHTTVETNKGITLHIFPEDLIIGAFGNRYATDQYEGYIPAKWKDQCDLLSIGGVCGEFCSAHSSMGAPTRLRVLEALCDASGTPLNLRSFAAPAPRMPHSGQVILVVGTSMNSGKTTTVGTLARALTRAGMRVAAAKITGTAAGKDGRFFRSCGADPVFDFTICGFPSTYMLGQQELLTICDDLFARLDAAAPDYSIIEIADGIFQRETRMLLSSDAFRMRVDHVFFAAGDSLGAECGVRRLYADGWPIRAVTGLVTASPLATREEEEATGMPCLNIDQLVYGEMLPDLVGIPKATAVGTSQVFQYAA